MASQQKVVLSTDSKERVEEEEEEEEELRDTKDAFYQYVFAKASRDEQLTRTEAVTLSEVRAELESSQETHGSGEAAELGRKLAVIGKSPTNAQPHTQAQVRGRYLEKGRPSSVSVAIGTVPYCI